MLIAMFCLFFISIGGAFASDANDMSNNPNFDSNAGDIDIASYSTDLNNEVSLDIVNDSISNNNLVSGNLISSDSDLANATISDCSVSDSDIISTYSNSVDSSDSSSNSQSTVSDISIVGSSAISDNSTVSGYSEDIDQSVYSDSSDKINTAISTPYDYVDKNSNINATLSDVNGNKLANQTVHLTMNITVNGVNYDSYPTYSATTNDNGVASFNIGLLANYTYTFTFWFDGNNNYNSAKNLFDITVITDRIGTIISNSAGSIINRGDSYNVTLTNINGNPLANQNISLELVNPIGESIIYYYITDIDGIVRLPINLILSPNWSINYGFAGSSAYKPSLGSSIFEVVDGSAINTAISGSTGEINQGDSFNVTLTDVNDNPLANQNVYLNLTSGNAYKVYNLVTDVNGVAKLPITLRLGSNWVMYYGFAGSSAYKPCSSSSGFSVVNGSAIVTVVNGSSGQISKGDYYYIYLTDVNGNPLANQNVYLNLTSGNDFKVYNLVTDATGVARKLIELKVDSNWTIYYGFVGSNSYKSSKGEANISVVEPVVPNTTTTIINGSGNEIVKGDYYNITLTDVNGNPLSGKTIAFSISVGTASKTYYLTTDANGVARMQINLAAINWTIKYAFDGDENYSASNDIGSLYVFAQRIETLISGSGSEIVKGDYYNISLTDVNGNPLSGKTIAFTISLGSVSKTYYLVTGANGVATMQINLLENTTWNVSYSYDGEVQYVPSSGSNSLTVKSPGLIISMAEILSVSGDIKYYIGTNYKMPDSIFINGVQYTFGQFVYLMSQALININAGSSDGVLIKEVANAPDSQGDSVSGQLYTNQYLDLANTLLTYINENGQLPNYVSTDVGKVEANLYLFALTKILAYYETNNQLPAYVTLLSSDVHGGPSLPTTQFIAGINEINTIGDLGPYYIASGYDAINSAIQNLANSLTSGLNSDWDKATAIFNYVRDAVSYSYYANSRYGASGTLTHKAGNCCDQANLIVSLCRAAGMVARFSHGQGCSFSSGLVTGHVWAQINVNGVWYAADATSVRNSLGHIVNWNVNSFYSLRQYVHLGF